MKREAREIIGKRKRGIVVKEGNGGPRTQVFLLFSDGTYYEFYGGPIQGTSGVMRGSLEEVRQYMCAPDRRTVFEAFDETVTETLELTPRLN